MNIDLQKYIENHIDKEPELLTELDRYTHLHVIGGRMVSGHVQGTLLKMLVSMVNPKNILEVGTFTAYSTIAMASGLRRSDAKIFTTEVDDELEPIIRRFVNASGFADRISVNMCSALELLNQVDINFDFVFIDGDKREYPAYYEAIVPRVTPGGYILADNTLWDGKVVQPLAHNDKHTKAVMDFNDLVATDHRVEKTIIPIRDGITLIRKK